MISMSLLSLLVSAVAALPKELSTSTSMSFSPLPSSLTYPRNDTLAYTNPSNIKPKPYVSLYSVISSCNNAQLLILPA